MSGRSGVGASRRASSRLELDERWARAAWAFLTEPCDAAVIRLLEQCGAVEALVRLRAGQLGTRNGWDVRLPELDLDAMARAAGHSQVRVVVPGDAEWPVGVDRLRQPPYCLFVRGHPDLGEVVERSVAVVGSRAATEYGLRVAADIADGLAARGFTVVSGAAYGVDSAAHRAALAADGPTVAVLACGADRAYPTSHRAMLEQIVATGGAVVSEVPVGCAPYRSRFLARNRIIATLARATVVVEANLRSGSLTTAKAASEHHLPVGAVPGPVTSMTSAGCHALLRETDAVLVTDAAEVAELAGRIGDDLLPHHTPSGPSVPGDDLDPESYRVWSAVPLRGGATLDRLASAGGVEARRLVGILAVLEAEGLVTKQAGRWRKTRSSLVGPSD
ncbi:MAG: DNA-processing protein DprA [Ornithinibacter sp.]